MDPISSFSLLLGASSIATRTLSVLHRIRETEAQFAKLTRVLDEVEKIKRILDENVLEAQKGRSFIQDPSTLSKPLGILIQIQGAGTERELNSLSEKLIIQNNQLQIQKAISTDLRDSPPLSRVLSNRLDGDEVDPFDSLHTGDLYLDVLAGGYESNVDIIFIHGLNGDPYKTWQASDSKDSSGQAKTILWPRDFLPKDFPDARVLTLGYSTHASADLNQLERIAEGLLSGYLRRIPRSQSSEPARKVLWVAHSLGGIIVKSALLRSWKSSDPNIHSIFKATVGMLFFGTPHRGSSSAAWSKMFTAIAGTIGANLKENSLWLNLLRDSASKATVETSEFKLLVDEGRVTIMSFFEETATGTGSFPQILVDKFTRLQHPKEAIRVLRGNHGSICKFQDRTEGGYLQVVRAIKIILGQTALPNQAERTTWNEFGSEATHHRPLTLVTKDVDDSEGEGIEGINIPVDCSRFRNALEVPRAFENSPLARRTTPCPWVIQSKAFDKWQKRTASSSQNCLCITGPHGCGKTSIAKTILEHFHPKPNDVAQDHPSGIIFFFFRGEEMMGDPCYRMLQVFIAQLLDRNPDLYRHVMQKVRSDMLASKIPEHVLLAILRSMLEDVCNSEAYCIIDGLDECPQSSRRAVVQMLGSLATIQTLNIAITITRDSSLDDLFMELDWIDRERHWNCFHQEICKESGFQDSMRGYIEAQLEHLSIGDIGGLYLEDTNKLGIVSSKTKTSRVSNSLDSFEFVSLLYTCTSLYPSSRGTLDLFHSIERWPDLSLIYMAMLRNILEKRKVDKLSDYALYTLRILCCVFEPLRFMDLENALSLREHSANSLGHPMSNILDALGAMIHVDSDGVHLSSTTLRAFLQRELEHMTRDSQFARITSQSQDLQDGSEALHVDLARDCLNCLIHYRDDSEIAETIQDVPFLSYAKQFWRAHLQGAGEMASKLEDLVDHFKNYGGGSGQVFQEKSKLSTAKTFMDTEQDLLAHGNHFESSDAQYPDTIEVDDLFESVESSVSSIERGPSEVPGLPASTVSGEAPSQPTHKEGVKTNGVGGKDSVLSKRIWWAVRGQQVKELFEETKISLKGIHRALEFAVELQYHEVVKELITKIPDKKQINFGKLLRLAAKTANESICILLLTFGTEEAINSRSRRSGKTPLHIAAGVGPLTLVQSLVKWGAQPGAKDLRGRSPIHDAAEMGHSDIALYFRSIGPKEEEVDKSYRTAFFYGCLSGSALTVQALLDDGCDMHHCDELGRTGLHAASKKGVGEVVRLLIRSGSEVNRRDGEGLTPLHEAASASWDQIVLQLLRGGADVEATDRSGQTPLHYACQSATAPEVAVKILLDHGAVLERIGDGGCRALHYAARKANTAVVVLLLDYSADPNAADQYGRTPLHHACVSLLDPRAKVSRLLRSGAKEDLEDSQGMTPIQFASHILKSLRSSPRETQETQEIQEIHPGMASVQLPKAEQLEETIESIERDIQRYRAGDDGPDGPREMTGIEHEEAV